MAGTVPALICMGVCVGLVPASGLFWAGSRHGEGDAVLEKAVLLVHSTSDREFGPWDHRYKWADIESADAQPFAQTGRLASLIAPLLGGLGRARVVVLTLNESFRSPIRPPFGTDTMGIPSIFVKQILLYCEEPDAFVAAALPFLRQLGDTPL